MDPLLLGALVAVATIAVLFSGISVALGLILVAMVFLVGFDVLGLVSVIEPATDPDEYAYIRFFPQGTKLEPKEATDDHDD